MKKLRIIVIGAGRMGTLHASKLARLEGVDVACIADTDLERATHLARHHGSRPVADWREGIVGMDAGVVAAPPEQHAAMLHGCLEAGLHVLVEKPVATTVDDARAMVALAERLQRVLQVAHVERFNAAFCAIASRIDRPLFIDAERLAGFQPRGAEVDVVLDLMIHDIDLALALARSPVTEVRACGFSVLTRGIDIANAHLEFESGCVADLSASRVSQAPVRKLRAFQHNLYASADLQVKQLRYVSRGGQAIQQSEETYEGDDPLARQDAAFIAAVRSNAPVIVTGDDGVKSVDVALRVARLVRERLQYIATKGASTRTAA
jgi:predicted dehydrogenase